MAIVEERYEDIIDAWENGVGVLEGESLTDYIKRNRIKIMDPFKNMGGEESKMMEGIETVKEDVQMAGGSGIDPTIRIEEVVKEFIKKYKRKPRSIEEIKTFYQNEMGTANRSQKKDMRMAEYNPGDYDPVMVEEYEKYKYDMNEQKPGFPVMSIDEFIQMEMGSAKLAGGGIPGILGV